MVRESSDMEMDRDSVETILAGEEPGDGFSKVQEANNVDPLSCAITVSGAGGHDDNDDEAAAAADEAGRGDIISPEGDDNYFGSSNNIKRWCSKPSTLGFSVIALLAIAGVVGYTTWQVHQENVILKNELSTMKKKNHLLMTSQRGSKQPKQVEGKAKKDECCACLPTAWPTTSLSPSEKSSSPSESTKPSPTPSAMPSVSDKPTSIEDKIKEILLLANVSERDELEDDTSPQGKALDWISSEAGGLESGEGNDIQYVMMPGGDDDQIIVRYILAVLYYSTNGDDWIDKGQW
eukprot:CAMPEP_0201698642 /NCGR_PEP_ID=MMETSP0578-20130828/20127_1 /ASSEMBLY_ACC=CAM_ASM_000663 /TAXON_ID=267565 /ORGANISM="Skeletonema grethea, Strain CCMP 1804" /LENGTH=291 /DNA_ID=CAMNT_0048185227 /DNA_START=112 /DNA_END=984 /DNA_ORIENTATION=-